MPQSPTSQTVPIVVKKAEGINDFESVVKLDPGFVPFSFNLSVESDAWNRRFGRTFKLIGPGPVLGIFVLTWDDGTVSEVTQIGDSFYDVTIVFTYLFDIGISMIIQSPDGNYWDVTPEMTTGEILPTVVAAPVALPQTSNFTVLAGQTIAYKLDATSVTAEFADQDQNGWFLQGYDLSSGANEISSDMVFTFASGFHFRIQDDQLNMWSFSVTNDGNIVLITV